MTESYELVEEAYSPLPGFVELPTCPVCLVICAFLMVHLGFTLILGVKKLVIMISSKDTLVASEVHSFPDLFEKAYGINHLVLPTRDYLFAPLLSDICQAVDFIHG
ncbi:hypothetical protein CsSME_00019462 [Camellia sinensis var. sinensis]